MKILFISECYPDVKNPQYCIYIEQQAMALAKEGHTVDIMIPELSKGNKSAIAEKTYNDLKIFNVLIKKGKFSHILPIYSLKDTLNRFEFKKYDVVSFHFVSNGLQFRIANICKGQGVPYVNHFHGLNVWRDYIYQKGLIYKTLWFFNHILKMMCLKKASAIVGVSDKVCDQLRLKIKNVPIFTVYNGVDNERFFSNKSTSGNKSFTVLCVANLIPIKGHDYLIEAISMLKKEGKQIRLQLIGVGFEEERLKEKCISLGIECDVEFLGAKLYDEVAEYMNKADMFIMPSYFEAFGCVYLEAMSSGTLTCGCYDTGADEIISHNIDGILVQKKSSEDIYNAIIFAMENPDFAKEMSLKGQQKAKKFSWDASAMKLKKVYEYVLDNNVR